MTPEATWLVLFVASVTLYAAGWVGWKLAMLHVRRVDRGSRLMARLTTQVDSARSRDVHGGYLSSDRDVSDLGPPPAGPGPGGRRP